MPELRVGVVGIAGAWSTDSLADALAERTGFRAVIDLAGARADLSSGEVWAGDLGLHELDGLVIKKLDAAYSPDMFSRLDVLRLLEAGGVRVFSPPARIAAMLNRLGCTTTLRASGIPMPPTTVTESLEQARAAVVSYGRAVIKPLYSTKARGMIVVGGGDGDLDAALARHRDAGNRCFYIQRLLALGDRDYGVVFLGGSHIGSYARVRAAGAWSTTTREGGHYERYHPSPEVLELARAAVEPFGLDYTSVDVAEADGEHVVFEVSAFGGFSGLRDGCGLDVAARYADYVVDELGRR